LKCVVFKKEEDNEIMQEIKEEIIKYHGKIDLKIQERNENLTQMKVTLETTEEHCTENKN
jgi:hypothetical protein